MEYRRSLPRPRDVDELTRIAYEAVERQQQHDGTNRTLSPWLPAWRLQQDGQECFERNSPQDALIKFLMAQKMIADVLAHPDYDSLESMGAEGTMLSQIEASVEADIARAKEMVQENCAQWQRGRIGTDEIPTQSQQRRTTISERPLTSTSLLTETKKRDSSKAAPKNDRWFKGKTRLASRVKGFFQHATRKSSTKVSREGDIPRPTTADPLTHQMIPTTSTAHIIQPIPTQGTSVLVPNHRKQHVSPRRFSPGRMGESPPPLFMPEACTIISGNSFSITANNTIHIHESHLNHVFGKSESVEEVSLPGMPSSSEAMAMPAQGYQGYHESLEDSVDLNFNRNLEYDAQRREKQMSQVLEQISLVLEELSSFKTQVYRVFCLSVLSFTMFLIVVFYFPVDPPLENGCLISAPK